MGRIYRPRVAATLMVPDAVGVATTGLIPFPLRVRAVSVTLNDHAHADEATVEFEHGDADVDPRLLKHGILQVHIGQAQAPSVAMRKEDLGRDTFTPGRQNLVFVGVVDTIERKANDGSGLQVSIKARDYTSFFLANKPYPSAGQPLYSQTLSDVWQLICNHTGRRDPETGEIVSSVTVLRNALEFRGGVTPGITLGKAVSERFARVGRVPLKAACDAWAAWQQCVGMLGLISWIDRDKCIVSTSTDLFIDAPQNRPSFVWGRNILDWSEKASSTFSDKGILIQSFDPIHGTVLEARFPEPGELQRKRKATQTKKGKPTKAVESENFDVFEYHGVTDADRLYEIAKRVYHERSLLELEGRLVTSEMEVETVGDADLALDLLQGLRAGVTLDVKIDPIDLDTFSKTAPNLRMEYLVARGYSASAAQVMVQNADRLIAAGSTFLTRSVQIHLAADGDSGKFEVEIGYVNQYRGVDAIQTAVGAGKKNARSNDLKSP